MEGDVDGGGAGVEALANHQDGLAVVVSFIAEEVDVGGQAEIAGGLFPDELELILAEPHVLAGAGGLPATASHLITINRPGVAQPIVIDLGPDPLHSAQANIPVFARDTVIVSRVGVVYVLGAFRTQGAIPLQQNTPLTLMQVAALGNGYGWEGQLNDVQLVRTVGLSRSVVHVDFKKVLKGQAPDPVLQTDDIVFLPSNSIRAAIKVGGINTLFGILSTIIFSIR